MFRKALTLAVVVGLAFTGMAFAQEADKECTGDAAECSGVCPVAAGMEKLPKMTYLIGEESTCCSKSAEKLAEESGDDIMFVVAKKKYDNQVDAMTALAEVTEKFVNDFATPSTCQVSGTTSVAGQRLHCSEKAANVAKAIEDAMHEVSLSYKVGDEECHCPTQAATLAKESGEKQLFVVGENTTCCPVDARIKLAHAKYRAALQALLAMEQTETETVES